MSSFLRWDSPALKAFKSPARISHAGFTGKLASNMEIVAERLKQASLLEPYRADLLFSSASAYIYNKEIEKALGFYNQILDLAPADVDAHTYLSAWQRYLGKQQESAVHMKYLTDLNLGRAQQLEKVFAVIDHTIAMPIRDQLPSEITQAFTGPVAIVTLGYALNPDGSMHETLIQRLDKTLELAKQLPEAMIIVTGGVPQNNQTEGRLMTEWLVKNGVDIKRIYQDNFARSTVENALFSRYALAKHRIKHAIVISSGSHVRRAQALFTIAGFETGPQDIEYIAVAALDKPLAELQKTSDGDRQGIYRDALKVMGLWSFRSYPLEER
jgi:uncharacterized SAM-binding protein YcdF (DUF218 family)